MGEIKTVYIPKGNEEAWKLFEEIAKREKGERGFSQLLNEIVVDYAKKHGSGNNQFTLEVAGGVSFTALPTIGETIPRERIDSMGEDTLIEIAKNGKARVQEAVAGLKRKGMTQWDIDHL